MNRTTTLLFFLLSTSLGVSSPALAQGSEDPVDNGYSYDDPIAADGYYPSTFTLRPLTLPRLALRGDFALTFAYFDFGIGDPVTVIGMDVGGAFGVLDDLEFGLGQSPIAKTLGAPFRLPGLGGDLSPDYARAFHAPHFYGRYRFVGTEAFDMGAEVGLVLPTEYTDLGIDVAIPMRIRAGGIFALDASVGLLTLFHEDEMGASDTLLRISVVVSPRLGNDIFYAGLDTGFSLPTENPERTGIPFMIEAGVTLDTGGATLDAYGNAGMPQFIRPGSEGDVVFTKHWQVLIGARVHIGFAS